MTIALALLQRYWLHVLLAVTAGWLGWEWRDRSADVDAAEARAHAERVIAEFAKAEAAAREQRDDLSAIATTAARDTTAGQLADHNTREQRVRTLVREVTVPAVCPSPSDQLMQELRAGEGRVRSASRRLSDQRRPASAAAADPRADG